MRQDDFERLYAEHAQALFGFLVYRTGDRTLAEDLLADTFERALRARRRFDPRRGSEKSWLYAIAANLVRDARRRSEAERRALTTAYADSPEERAGETARVDDRTALLAAMEHLTDDEREAIALRYGADLTLQEVARAIGARTSTVEGRVYRGLAKLRSALSAPVP